MASGLVRRAIGRTHGCTDQPANVKKSLANSEPSTHGTKQTYRGVYYFVCFRGEADICEMVVAFAAGRGSKRSPARWRGFMRRTPS